MCSYFPTINAQNNLSHPLSVPAFLRLPGSPHHCPPRPDPVPLPAGLVRMLGAAPAQDPAVAVAAAARPGVGGVRGGARSGHDTGADAAHEGREIHATFLCVVLYPIFNIVLQ